jgi:hypothetical protein
LVQFPGFEAGAKLHFFFLGFLVSFLGLRSFATLSIDARIDGAC